jgi:hypothetical protein
LRNPKAASRLAHVQKFRRFDDLDRDERLFQLEERPMGFIPWQEGL